jgi:hypothetical protein
VRGVVIVTQTVAVDREQQRIVATDSKSDSSSDENAGSNIAGTATWGKVDKTPTLGQFTGNPGVKQIPSDSTQVSEVAELFLEIVSLTCYVSYESAWYQSKV